jgi:hypothetical protein
MMSAWVCGAFLSGLLSAGQTPVRSCGSRRGCDHRGDEAVEFGLRFRFGRLDHDRAGHREADRRRVEAVVHQALGDVDLGDAGGGLDRADVEDALVRDAALLPV